MKRIGLVANTSWNLLNFRSALIRELQESYEVILIAPYDNYTQQIETIAETKTIHQLSRKGTNPITDLLLVRELQKLYTSLQLDGVIHFTIKPNIYGSFAAHLSKVPSLAVVTGLGYTFLSNGFSSKIAKLLYKQAFQRNSHTVFQNIDDRELFVNTQLVDESKSRVINGSGIDMDYFSPKPNQQQADDFTFLFVGRLLYDKGIRELFDAFDEVTKTKPCTLHIVGEIDQNNPSAFSVEELNRRIQQNQSIIYHGKQEDLRDYYANCDCVVLPSYREGLPRVMLEAMAMAKPIITTNVPGCRQTVSNGNGFLVKVNSANDLAQNMKKVRNLSAKELEAMGKNGRQLAENQFSTTVVNQQYKTLVEQLFKTL